MSYVRIDGRTYDELRPVEISRNFVKHADGSVLIRYGDTKIICTATVEEKTPSFLKGTGSGWITAEYGMLPGATSVRSPREASRGKQTGRTIEIQRLIGRSLRAITDLIQLGERTIYIDCDVIQADGGTRTASITGGFIALADAIRKLKAKGLVTGEPIREHVAAVSVGKIENVILLDLNYEEDSKAEVDMNCILTEGGNFVEIQGTGEKALFTHADLASFVSSAERGIKTLIELQKQVLNS